MGLKWSKREAREAWSAVGGALLHLGNGDPQSYSLLPSDLEAYRAKQEALGREKAPRLAVWYLEGLASLRDDSAAKARSYLDWLASEAGAKVYPDVTSRAESAEKFRGYLREYEKEAAWYRKLVDKIQAHGMPENPNSSAA